MTKKSKLIIIVIIFPLILCCCLILSLTTLFNGYKPYTAEDFLKTYSTPIEAVENYPWNNQDKNYPMLSYLDSGTNHYLTKDSCDIVYFSNPSIEVDHVYEADLPKVDNNSRVVFHVSSFVLCNPLKNSNSEFGFGSIVFGYAIVEKQTDGFWRVTRVDTPSGV